MMSRILMKAGASLLLLGAVAACGDNDGPDDVVVAPPPEPPAPPPPPPPTGEADFADEFGAAFSAIFARAATADPVDPQASDVPPLAPASDPVANDG
ncbi:MAG: hypothetical protein WA948_03680 [Pontixanthobacter sp.]